MHCLSLNVVFLTLLASASATTHKVEVGKGGLRYAPDTIKAAKGDVIEFRFNSMHTVVASDFNKPCAPATSGGFYSGELPKGDNSFFSVTINNTDPIFFYCAIESHCQAGMVGVINQATDTLDDYKSAAEKTDKSSSPKSIFGGTLSSKSSSSTSGSQSSATTTGASAASTTSESAATSASVLGVGNLAGPVAGVTCLAIMFGAMLAL
ncbi:extracellular serine-rich [Fusarium albosuccineum]|uniref:Extracellular serine-rich n=1 Tax=Fusarium albosuccineum TaxID=1237068 RepID=A0A8H4P8X1_9HYPO|nr:extracellular serine-rich [Fusarium albosuccineum]